MNDGLQIGVLKVLRERKRGGIHLSQACYVTSLPFTCEAMREVPRQCHALTCLSRLYTRIKKRVCLHLRGLKAPPGADGVY